MDAKVTEFVVISITQYEEFVRLQERFEMAKEAMGSSPYPDRNRWELLRMVLQAEDEQDGKFTTTGISNGETNG